MGDPIRWVRTHCARMDHGGCALLVGVKDNRIVKIKGDPDGFLNKGYVCLKGVASADRLVHPGRLLHPLRRVGGRGEGRWRRISWDEALGVITENLSRTKERLGARSVAFCQGMPKGMEHFVLIRLANLFGSPNVVAIQDVCHAPREISGVHTCGFYPVPDYRHPGELVVLWGSNITATNEEGGICSQLREKLRQGTRLMVVDPRRTELAERAQHWLQIKPGTDNALAMAFCNVIIDERLYDADFVDKWTHGFDQFCERVAPCTPEKVSRWTWIPAAKIREAARTYAASRPAALGWGNPIEQNAGNFHTARALVCLMALCGNLDVPGGNIAPEEPSILGLGPFVKADLIPQKRKEMLHAYHRAIPRLMTVPPAYFRKAVLEDVPYPVRAAYVQCANPLLAYADSMQTRQVLEKLDFLAVSDVFMTPTAALADIVLPAATQFEFNDMGHYGIGHGYVLARPKVVEPPGECRPDVQILNDLGKALTAKEHWWDHHDALLEEVLGPAGLDYGRFAELGYLKGADRFRKHEAKGFKTPTGKVELVLSQGEKMGLAPFPEFYPAAAAEDEEYPLVLTSSKNPLYLHSSYRWVERLRAKSPRPVVEMHPDTASLNGVREGDEVWIRTRKGSIFQWAHITDRVDPRVIHAAYGWWFPEGDPARQYEWEATNFNMLTSTEPLGREFGTPNLKGIGCRIEKK